MSKHNKFHFSHIHYIRATYINRQIVALVETYLNNLWQTTCNKQFYWFHNTKLVYSLFARLYSLQTLFDYCYVLGCDDRLIMFFTCPSINIKSPVKPWFYGTYFYFSVIYLWRSAERQGTIKIHFPYSLSASYQKPLLLWHRIIHRVYAATFFLLHSYLLLQK